MDPCCIVFDGPRGGRIVEESRASWRSRRYCAGAEEFFQPFHAFQQDVPATPGTLARGEWASVKAGMLR